MKKLLNRIGDFQSSTKMHKLKGLSPEEIMAVISAIHK